MSQTVGDWLGSATAAQPAGTVSDWLGPQPLPAAGPNRSVLGEAAVGVARGVLRGPAQMISAGRAVLDTIGQVPPQSGAAAVFGGVPAAARLVSDWIGPTERAASTMTDLAAERVLPRSPRDGLWDARGIAGDLGETAPQLGQAVAAGVVAGPAGPAGAIAAFAGTAAAPVVGQTYQDAMREHGDQDRAAREAAANGAVTAVTSMVPGAAFLRRIPGGGRILDAVTRRLVGRVGLRAVAEGGQEAAEQAGQIFNEEFVRRGATPEQAAAAVAGRMDEVGYAGLLGTLAGGGASVAVEAAGAGGGSEAASGASVAPDAPAATQAAPAGAPASEPTAALRDWVAANPEQAAAVAAAPQPSRGVMERAGLPAGNAARRAETQRQVRALLAPEAVAEPDAAPDADRAMAHPQPTAAATTTTPQPHAPPSLSREPVPLSPTPQPQPIPEARVPIRGPLSEHQIRRRMERDFSVPIRRGRTGRRAALGIFKLAPEVVRIVRERFGDVGVAAHEVAHKLDQALQVVDGMPQAVRDELKTLDYDPQAARDFEGFAEFIRYAITHDDVAQRAPVTAAWFQNTFLPANPEVAERLGRARAMTTRWRGQTPSQRVGANVADRASLPAPLTPTEKMSDWIGQAWRQAYRSLVDSGTPLRDMEQAARRRGERVPTDSPHATFLSLQMIPAHYANEAVRGRGIISLHDRQTVLYDKSLRDILGQIPHDQYEDWRKFIYARHAIEAWDKNINPGITRLDAEATYRQFENKPGFLDAAEQFTDWNNALLGMLAETGAISATDLKQMQDKWQTYIPLVRAVGDEGGAVGTGTAGSDFANPMLKRHGADLPIVDPVLVAMRKANALYQRAATQEIIESVIDLVPRKPPKGARGLDEPGMGEWAERVPPNMVRSELTVGDIRKQLEDAGVDSQEITNHVDDDDTLFFYRPSFKNSRGESVVQVYRDGKRELWRISPDLLEAMDTAARTLGKGGLESAMQFLQVDKLARATRLGATGINPSFTLTNTLRDLATYSLQSRTRNPLRQAAALPAAMARIIVHNVKSTLGLPDSGVAELFNRMGGAMTSRIGMDFAELAAQRDKALAQPATRRALRILTPRGGRDAAMWTLGFVRDVVNATEAMPRVAEFTESLRREGYSPGAIRNGATVPRAALIKAFNAASDVTTNFRRSGTSGRALNQYIPFLNARIQGHDKFFRTWEAQPWTTALRLAVPIAATIAYWALRRDDDEYKEEPDWLKYQFWTFTDADGRPTARIPRPHDWGWLTAGVQAGLDAAYQADPGTMRQFAKTWLSQFSLMQFAPAGVKQGLELYANYDSFRQQPIVDQGLARFAARDQTTPETTLLARALGHATADTPAPMSPVMVDHFLNGVSGGAVGRYMRFGEAMARGDFAEGSREFAAGGVTFRADYMRSINEFYDAARAAEQDFLSSRIAPNGDTRNLDAGDIALGDRYHAMTWYAGVMSDLRELTPPDADRDERYRVNRYIAGIARHALGEEPLETFPNPLRGGTGLPPDVAAVVRDNLARLRKQANQGGTAPSTVVERRRARGLLRAIHQDD